jgi:hypothetical protein
MALSKKIKKYLDSLSDDELYYDLALRFGHFVPVWKEVSKKEYEENYGKEDDNSWENLVKWCNSPHTYKREPHWKNVQAGIMWQIEHYHDKPDYYTYYKLINQEFTLMLGSDIIDYLNNRKPNWYDTI